MKIKKKKCRADTEGRKIRSHKGLALKTSAMVQFSILLNKRITPQTYNTATSACISKKELIPVGIASLITGMYSTNHVEPFFFFQRKSTLQKKKTV